MTLIEKIREMIAEGQTEKSLDELLNYVKDNNDDVIDRLILLKSRINNLNKSIISGTVENEEATLERAKINEAVLKLLSEITPSYLEQSHQIEKTKNEKIEKPKSKTWLYVLLGVIAIGLLIVINTTSEPNDMTTTPVEPNAALEPTQVFVSAQAPIADYDLQINNEKWMRIRLPGKIMNAQGRTCYLITHFLYNGKVWQAAPNDVRFRDSNGNVAVYTQRFIVPSNDYDLTPIYMDIPYSSLNLAYTGGKQRNDIEMYIQVFIDEQPVWTSPTSKFWVMW